MTSRTLPLRNLTKVILKQSKTKSSRRQSLVLKKTVNARRRKSVLERLKPNSVRKCLSLQAPTFTIKTMMFSLIRKPLKSFANLTSKNLNTKMMKMKKRMASSRRKTMKKRRLLTMRVTMMTKTLS